jgi:Acetyltransferases, including N-acetylases of ribosomal proteins
MLRGEYVTLRVPGHDDVDIITAWKNDREVAGQLFFNYPSSKWSEENLLDRTSQDRSTLSFIIETEDNIPIGIGSFINIDWIYSTAQISVIIYAKNCWGRGYGYDTVKTLTEYGLQQMNFHTVYANIFDGNERAVKCFEKAGFETEGVLRHRVHRDGKYINVISMSICRDNKED